jgi:spore coat polysaccharide biosynthesis predicted glycosyltransferase SpsG
MTRAPILFRVDAAPRVGWEHLSRCLVFAAALQRRRRPAHFLAELDPASLALGVKRAGNEWVHASAPAGTKEDVPEILRQINKIRPAAVVVDAPEVGEAYLDAVAGTGTAVVSFDSFATQACQANLLINPLLGPAKEAYDIKHGTQVLLGARYAMVRPEIRRLRPIRSQEPIQPFRALVALGDDDPNNQSAELAKLLLNCPKVGRVDVAVRPYHRDLAGLQALAETCSERLEIISENNELPLRVARCHFALTGANAWSLELACVGVPQLVVVQSEVHWPTAQRLEEEGAVTCLGWHANVSPQTVRQAVANILSDPLERLAMARAGRKLIDGRGPDRLVTALEIVLHRPRFAAPVKAIAA